MKHSRLLLMIVVTMIATLPIPTLGQVIDSMSTLPPEPIDQRDESLAVSFMASAAVSADVLAGEDALSEVSIDVNPTNPDNQVIVGHDGGLTTMNTFYTMDGGLTWTPVLIGNAVDGLSSIFRFDPTVAFDDDGNVYAGYGARTAAAGGGNQTTLVVCRSSDGGATYPTCTLIDTNLNIGGLPGNDKWHLATGPDPLDPAQQNVYIAWTRNVLEASGLDQRIVVSMSTDAGVTFSAPLTINDPSIAGSQAGNLFADPAVGPNGELYVAWHQIGTGQVWLDVSLDGGVTFGTDSLVTTSATGFKTPIPAQPDRGVHVGPTIDADRSGGPFTGNLYLTYTDLGPGGLPDVDVLVMRSTDGGVTWSVPMIVHDDVGTNSQFLPWLDVDQQTGLVSTVWYDARNDANNKKVEVFLAVSFDGGASWDPNIVVSDNPSDQSTDNPNRYLGNFLEYIGVASLGGMVFPVWADNSLDPADLDYFTDQILIASPPVADANGPYTGNEGSPITFDGSGSSAPGDSIVLYEWDFDNDGIYDFSSTSPTANYTWPDDHLGTVVLRVTNSLGVWDTDSSSVTVNNVPPAVDPPIVVPSPSDEGDMVVAGATFSDPGADSFQCMVDYGDGSGPVAGTVAGTECTGPAHTYQDNGAFAVMITVEDDDDGAGSNQTTQHVSNVAPIVGPITAPADPAAVGESYCASADFTDPGVLDTHTAMWDWGDETTSVGTVAQGAGSGSVGSDCHTYSEAGVYTVVLTVTDNDGDSGQSILQYAVIYDPDAGFVTGGGWIDSPAGAYVPDPTLTGKANFGFVSKYKKGRTNPEGSAEFQFHAGDLDFHSNIQEWLVIAGPKAMFKGVGTINGSGNYGFLLKAIDANLTPSTDADLFSIKIWDEDNSDAVVYDNGLGDAVDDDPSTQIAGGSIVIHKKM